MRKADKNEDNQMTLKELKHFLRQINVEVDDTYAEDIFRVSLKQTTKIIKMSTSQSPPDISFIFFRNVTNPTQAPWRAPRSSTSTTCSHIGRR